MNQWFDLLKKPWQGHKIQHVLDQFEPEDNPRLVNEASENFSNSEYFVFFESSDESKTLSERTATTLSEAGINVKPAQFYDAINGFLIELTPSEAKQLRQSEGIQSVEADRPMPITPPVDVQPEQRSKSSITEISATNSQNFKSFQTNSLQEISLDRFWSDNQNHLIEQQLSKKTIGSISALPVYNNGTASSG